MSGLSEEHIIRQNKLRRAKKSGLNPYPARVDRSYYITQVLTQYKNLLDEEIVLVGRIKAIRLHGGSCFAHIEDGTEKIQIYLKRDELGSELYNQFKNIFDIGDFVEIKGTLFTTKRGEKSLLVNKFRLISKSLLPLPEKWHGLSDVEIRYRKRYLDLIANPEIKKIFKVRSLLIKTIRTFLNNEGFMEVETPILQPLPGGANARPFKTHHQALNTDLYLSLIHI